MVIAYDAHHGQQDKVGVPYIYHPIHLAEQMADEVGCAAALLHDVVEDTHYSLEDLRARGVGEDVLKVVEILTHKEGEGYMDYIRRIKDSRNEVAVRVKLTDLRHNSDFTRLDAGSGEVSRLREKYKEATEYLLGE
jgi:(p)ppGpp synthase/HD superfamily hydrolase